MLSNTKHLKKVIKGLKKASKSHAKQAKTLTRIEKNQRTQHKRTTKKKK